MSSYIELSQTRDLSTQDILSLALTKAKIRIDKQIIADLPQEAKCVSYPSSETTLKFVLNPIQQRAYLVILLAHLAKLKKAGRRNIVFIL